MTMMDKRRGGGFASASSLVSDFRAQLAGSQQKNPCDDEQPRVGTCQIHGKFEFTGRTGTCPKCLKIDQLKSKFAQAGSSFVSFAHQPFSERDFAKTFENYEVTEKNQKAVHALKRFAERFPERLLEGKDFSCRGAILLGNAGTGKSHLASAICNSLTGWGPVYISASTFFDLYLAGLDLIQLTKAFAKVSVLIIDELGRSACTPHELRRLQSVLDARTTSGLPTIFIANLQAGEVGGVLGEAIASRVKGSLWPIIFDWPDYRKTLAQKAALDGEYF